MRLVTDKPFYRPPSRVSLLLKEHSFVIVNSVDYIDCLFLHSVNGDNSYFFSLFSSAALVLLQLEQKEKAKV
jgi:hypothetical protein